MKDRFQKDLEKATQNIVVVEGKKDKSALQHLGFHKVFVIHETGKSIYEKIEQLAELCDKKDRVCILTDFDKKGKSLYMLLKSKLPELGIRLDNSFRGVLLKKKISHIEGLDKFLKNQEQNPNAKYKSKKHR